MSKRLSETITDEEIERITQETVERAHTEPRMAEAEYYQGVGLFVFKLRHGVTVECPAAMFDALKGASPEQLGNMQTMGDGYALEWPDLDVQMTTIALLQIALKMRSLKYVVSKAGSVRSPAKAASSRENGKKGGRPRKREVAETTSAAV